MGKPISIVRIRTLARCLAMAIAVTAGASVPLAAAYAQSQSKAVEFNIPAGDLAGALDRFAEQSGLQVVSDQPLVKGLKASALTGRHKPADALKALLRGTNLEYSFVNESTIVIRRARPTAPPPAAQPRKADLRSDAQDATELETITVTGSNIRRTDIEGPSPLIVISRQDLDRSGRSNVAEALAQLPQNFSSPILAGTSANGARAINLRGLGSDNTLVLVNGRRQASSGSSGNSPFVDLNSIPLVAVERIEVLTDGASAVYGADAVTGVVNIILKKDFQGSELNIGYGASVEGGADERQFSFTTGWAKGGFSAMVAGEYFKRDRLDPQDRSFSRTNDLRAQGGRDFRVNFANPGNVSSLSGQNLPGLGAPFAAIPHGQDGRGLMPSDFSATAGQINLQSLNSDFSSLIPESERSGLYTRFDGQLSSSLTFFGEVGASQSKTRSSTNPPVFNVVVPTINPFNPFGQPVRVTWLATELPTVLKSGSDSQRITAGLQGGWGPEWNWETSAGYSRDTFERFLTPLSPPAAAVNALLARSDLTTALNVFGDGVGANSPGVLAELGFGRQAINGVGRSKSVNAKADGPILEWAGRQLNAAAGWEYRDEDFESKASAQVSPLAPGTIDTIRGNRDVVAGFVELGTQLFEPEHGISGIRALELQLAGRFEHYSDFGDTANPKFAFRWQPVETIAVRGSIGTSFRAPSLRELFLTTSPATLTVTDPRRGREQVVVDLVRGGNKNLEPEESRNWNFGFVWDTPLSSQLSLTVDFWSLRQEEQITTLGPDALLAAEAFFPNRITRAAPSPGDLAVGRPGRLRALDLTSLNASEARLRGVDLGVMYGVDSSAGRFDVNFSGSYIHDSTRRLTPVSPVEKLEGTLSGVSLGEDADRPEVRAKANLSLFWRRNAWEIGVTERYTGRARDPFSVLHPIVDDHYETDLQLNYVWSGDSGPLAGTRVTLGGENVFNTEPPFRDAVLGFSSALYSPRQAFYYLRLTKSF